MLFIVLFLCLIAGANRYLWMRLVRDTRLPRRASYLATALIILLAGSLPLLMLVWAGWSRTNAPLVNFVAFSWLGISFYLVMLLLASDAVRAGLWLWRRGRPAAPAAVSGEPAPPDATETRRVFVARGVAGGALLAAGGIGSFGMRAALWDITTPEIHVVLPRLPRALDGFSIALLTDVHIGPLLDGRFLRHLVEQTNALKPDLIAIGGDLIDGSVPQIGHHVAELRHLQSKYGTYFVTGNHEYYAGADQWVDFLRSLGIRVLINSRLAIGDEGASFDLVGLPDFHAGRVGAEEPQIEKAIIGRDPERELIVLAHQPVQIQQAAIAGAGLQLSGHTHGGQLYPFGALTRLVQPYLAGLYRHTGTDTQIYVSRGSGFWGPPMRVLAPAEISLLRLSAG
jgi:predicted MPP superfamily phosphohydrolase